MVQFKDGDECIISKQPN